MEELITLCPWDQYSTKLIAKIDHPRNGGTFTSDDAKKRGMRLVVGSEGDPSSGDAVRLYWLIDENDGVIADARFQAFGQPALIGAADAACDLVIRKDYGQVQRISADLLDKQLRDKNDVPAFPQEAFSALNSVVGAIDDAASHCQDIPLPESYEAPPIPADIGEIRDGGYPGWDDLVAKEKLAVIEQVLDQEVRPYMALDGGGVQVRDLIDTEVIVSYEGNCASCFAATGATLSYIENVLRAKVHPQLCVIPRF